jgi:hypothetical protein
LIQSKRRDHDLLSAGLNLIRSEGKKKTETEKDVRMIVNAYLLLKGTIQDLGTGFGKGQTVINKLRFREEER